MTKYGVIFSYWDRDWDLDYMEVLQRSAKAGAECVEFQLSPTLAWSDARREDFLRCARDLNLEILFNGSVGNDGCTYSDDPAVRDRGIRTIRGYLKYCARCGVTFLDGIYSEGWPSAPGRVIGSDEKKKMTDRVVAAVREMAKTAEDYGVLMCMEPVNRFENFLVNTAAEARYVAGGVGSPNFKVTADTFHMHIEEDGIEDGLRTLGKEYIGHVHLGEANRKLPGKGKQMDWDGIFGTLREIGYEERLLLEPFVLAEGTVSLSVSLWRDLSEGASADRLTEELKDSLAFVRGKFEHNRRG